MAKNKNPRTNTQVSKTQTTGTQFEFLMSDTNKIRYILLAIIALAILLFFKQGIFEGKLFASADNLSPLSFKTFLDDAKAQGIQPLWLPYIFTGMPALASLTASLPAVYNISSYLLTTVLAGFSGSNLFLYTLPFYFIFAVSLFYYARYKFKNNLIGLYASLMGVFATGIIQLIIVGHHTKMMTISFFPLIMLFLDKIIESENENKFKLLFNFALLALLLYVQLSFHHIQMLIYSYMMMGIYIGYNLIYRLIKKYEVQNIIRAVALFIVAMIFAVSMDADIILSVKEYNKYSIRGESSVTAKVDQTKSEEKPLSYEYATNWSFSPGEVLTFISPYYYGFGNVEMDGKRTNLYWGQMPFTDSPVYFGVITLMLALIGIFLNFRKNPFVQALTFIVLFFLFLSFGRTFPLIYDMFYYHVPFFSSFRAPVMIHYYIDLAFLILGCFGLSSLITLVKDGTQQDKLKKMSYFLFAIAGFMMVIAIIGFESSYASSVASGPLADKIKQQGANPQQVSQYIKQISNIAYKNVISDLLLHSILLLMVITMIYFYINRKISLSLLLVGTIIVALFDILNVSVKTLHWDDKGQKEAFAADTDYSKWLLNKEPETYQYRVAEFNRGALATSNNLAYFRFHCFNGYQGAKLRIYQDAIDVAGGENPFLLGLANVKYIISDSPIKDTLAYRELYKGSNIIYQNKFALPRAFFVDEFKIEKGLQILQNIQQGNFNPMKIAFLEKDPGIKVDKPDSVSTNAKIIKFGIHNIEYEVNASGNNFLVLNEVYYPAGWKASIDGNETEIYKTNYLQRGIIVPIGKHKVEMVFHPNTYYTGRNISIATNVLVFILLFAGIG